MPLASRRCMRHGYLVCGLQRSHKWRECDRPHARKDAQPNQPQPRSGLHKPRREGAGPLPPRRCLEKKCERLGEVVARLCDIATLACDIDFRTQRHIAIALAFDDYGQASVHRVFLISLGICIVQENSVSRPPRLKEALCMVCIHHIGLSGLQSKCLEVTVIRRIMREATIPHYRKGTLINSEIFFSNSLARSLIKCRYVALTFSSPTSLMASYGIKCESILFLMSFSDKPEFFR